LFKEEEQAITHKGERGYDIGVTAWGLILQEACVLAPMIADFATAPMATDEAQPLLWCIAINRRGTEVIAGSLVFGFLVSC